MTQPEIILAAARSLPQPFTVAELVVASWRAAPTVFGLPGFEDLYPHSKRVEAAIYGQRRLVALGLLVPDGDRFRISDTAIRRLDVTAEETPPKPAGSKLRKLLWLATISATFGRFHLGIKASITYVEALEFWGLPGRAKPEQIREAVAAFEAAILGRETQEHRTLGACHDYLVGRFSRLYAVPKRSSA